MVSEVEGGDFRKREGIEEEPVRKPALELIKGDSLKKFEELLAELVAPRYVLRLYVAGSTSRSANAISNVREICEKYLPGRYDLEIVDVYQQPGVAKREDVVAIPTLIKDLPLPSRSFVGDMSNKERILIGLNLR